jgi:hypothetical protein
MVSSLIDLSFVWLVFVSLHEGGATRESRRMAGFPVRFHTHISRRKLAGNTLAAAGMETSAAL